MRINKKMKKWISALLCLCMLVQNFPMVAFAAEDNLCEHHPEHTAECGYAAAVTGADCTHVCGDGSCSYAAAVEEVPCVCTETDENGAPVHTEGCGYVAPAEGVACDHSHDSAVCSYVQAVEGQSCTYHCEDCLNHQEEEKEEEEKEQDPPAPSSEAVEPAGPLCGHGNNEESCDVCVSEIQAMVNALPDMVDISDENRDVVISQLEAIDSRKWKLSDEARNNLEFGKYEDAAFALGTPKNFFGFAVVKRYEAGVSDTPQASFAFLDEAGVAATVITAEGLATTSVEPVSNGGAIRGYLPAGEYTMSETVAGDWNLTMAVNGKADSDLTFTAERGRVYSLVFVNAVPYAVTLTPSEYGSVTASVDEEDISFENYYVRAGKTVTLTVNPDAGYLPDTLTVLDEYDDPVEITKVGENTYTFEMPYCVVSVTGTFKACDHTSCNDEHQCEICGLQLEHTLDHNGFCTGCGMLAVASVTIGGTTTYVKTLDKAIQAVKDCTAADHAVVTLLKDIPLGIDPQRITSGTFTLDLNGFELSSDNNSCVLSISGEDTNPNVTITGGKISAASNNSICVMVNFESTLTIIDSTISATGQYSCGVYAGFNSDVTIIGGKISGTESDLGNYESTITLDLGKDGIGTTFPDGLTVSGTTLKDILGEGAAYWQGDKMIVPDEGQTEITGGDVTIKAACDHANATPSATDVPKRQHMLVCPCGAEVAEDHSFDSATDKCVCGVVGYDLRISGVQMVGMEGQTVDVTALVGNSDKVSGKMIFDPATWTLNLDGTCAINSTTSGIYVETAPLTIRGGMLDVDAGMCGISAGSTLVIDSCALDVSGETAIWCDDSVRICNGSNVIADAPEGFAIISQNLTVENSVLLSDAVSDNVSIIGASHVTIKAILDTIPCDVTVDGDYYSRRNFSDSFSENGDLSTGSSYLEIVTRSHTATTPDKGGATHSVKCSCGDVIGSAMPHTLTYTANGAVITAVCAAGCGNSGTATIHATGKTYDGESVMVTVTRTGCLENTEIPVSCTKDGKPFTGEIVNTGDYTAAITLGDATAALDFTIAKADYDMSEAKWDYTDAFIYDGQEKTVCVTGLPQGVTASYTGNKASAAGDYTAKAVFTYDETNFNAPTLEDLSWKIENNWDPTEFTLSGEGWLKADLVITADEGYSISRTNSAAGDWTETLTESQETAQGKVTFFLKNKETGAISLAKEVGYRLDKTVPTGTIAFDERTGWQEFLNNISFNLFYKSEVTVTIDSADAVSGVKSVEYFASRQAMNLDQVKAITDWTAYSGGVAVTLEDAKQFVYYARITDNAGHVNYLSTDGAEYDTTAPVISGIENGKTYYTTQTATVTDKNLDTLTLNGQAAASPVILEGDKDATYTILAKDKAGNETSLTITMKPIASLGEIMEELTTGNVTSADKDAIQDVLDAVEELLEDDSLSDEEKESLEDLQDQADELLDAIDQAADALKTEDIQKVEDKDKTNVTLDDTADLEKAKEALEEALRDENKGNYTAEEQTKIQQEIDRLEQAIEAIEQTEDVIDAIDQLDTEGPDLEEAEEKAIRDAKEAFDKLTDHQKSLMQKEDKEKLEKYFQSLTDYEVIKGHGSKWEKGSVGALTITANGPARKFKELRIDKKVVDPSHYTYRSGSTIITLKASFLQTLSTGKHTIQVVFNDGETEGNDFFRIYTDNGNPMTGDDSDMILFTGMAATSLLGLVMMLLSFRKKRKGEHR